MNKLILCFLLCISSNFLIAQDKIVFKEHSNPSYEFKFKNSSDANQTQINTIIQSLSKENGQALRNTEYTISYSQQLKITQSDRHFNAEIKINNIVVSGSHQIKNLDVSDVLLPDHLKLDVTIVANAGQPKINYNNTVYKLKPNQNAIEFIVSDSSITDKIKIIVNKTEFVYTNQDVAALNNRIKLIKDYYSTESNLQTAYASLQTINANDIDLIDQHLNTLKNVDALIDKLKKEDYATKLNLQKSDPTQYVSKLNSLIDLALKTHASIDFVLKTLDQMHYNKGVDLLSYGKVELAIDHFYKSISFNPLFAPSHFQLAKIDFEKGKSNEAELRIKDVLYKMNPDPLTQEACMKLLFDITDFYYMQAQNLISQHKYETALEHLYKMQSLCSSVPNLGCKQDVLQQAIAQAKLGIYFEILSQANSFLERDDLKNAEIKVNEASGFQVNNSKYIKSNAEALSILSKIYVKHYNIAILKGEQFLKVSNYQAAIDEFENAEKIEKEYGFTRHADLSALEQKAAKPLIKKLIEEGNSYVQQNYVSSAKSHINKIETMQAQYGLSEDEELNTTINELKQKLYTQECLNANKHYNQLIEKANQEIMDKSFVEAQAILKNAKDYAGNNGVCIIPATIASQKLNEIYVAATYQSMLEESANQIRVHNYDVAIQKYLQASTYFDQYKVTSFGLTHIETFQYFSSASNNEFKVHGANYYLNQKEYDKCMVLLVDVANRNYKSKFFKQLQMRFAREKATLDIKEKPFEDPKSLALDYTKGHPKLKFFKKAYVKQWKKLDR